MNDKKKFGAREVTEFKQENWTSAPAREVSTTEMDQAIKAMQMMRKIKEDHKEKGKALEEDYEKAQARVLELLEASGKTKYFVEDLGTVNVINKFSVRVPKELTAKRELFNWIKDKHGVDALDSLLSINHITLNAFVNEQKAIEPLVEIAGLDAPTHEKVLRFTAKK